MLIAAILSVVGSQASYATAASEDRDSCAECLQGTYIEYCTAPSFEFLILNACSDILGVTGAASGRAVSTYWYTDYAFLTTCEPHEPISDSYFDGGFEGPPGGDNGVVSNGYLSIAGGATSVIDCDPSFAFTVDLDCDPTNGPNRIAGSSQAGLWLHGYTTRALSDLEQVGAGGSIVCGVAGFDSEIDLTMDAPLEISATVGVDVTVVFDPYDDCVESRGRGGAVSDPLVPDYAGEEYVITIENVSTNETYLVVGVIGVSVADGSLVALGDFDDSGIVISTGDGPATAIGSITILHDFAAAGNYRVSQRTRVFGNAAGDFNGDGEPTPADYDVIDFADGSTIGDQNYWASVDLDLDGDVDSADVSRAYDILDVILDSLSCPADLTNDDQLNFFDIATFLDLYNAQDPAADLAAPFGSFNFFDIAAYMNLYNAGCP